MARCRLRPTPEDAAITFRAMSGTHGRCHALQTMLLGDDDSFALLRAREVHKVECFQVYGVSPSWAAIARMEALGGSLARCFGQVHTTHIKGVS